MTSKTCYLCDKIATSVEHVPPKCIFPEQKDLPDGINLRNQLYTVPSCDEHNLKKSHDDEYFLYALGISNELNQIGRTHYKTKIRRAIKRNPSLLKRLSHSAVPVKVIDPHTQKQEGSFAITFEAERFDNIIGQLSRAIYFHHYQGKWIGDVKYQAEFLSPTIDPSDDSNRIVKEISEKADVMFASSPYFGENPEVFKYQVVENQESKCFRLHFYEGCKILLIFDSQHRAAVDRQGGAAVAG